MVLLSKNTLIEVFVLLYLLDKSLAVDLAYHVDDRQQDTSFGVVLTYYVQEGQSPGTYVGDIAANAKFLDSFPPQDHSLITFSQLHESVSGNSQLFNVSKTGKLYTGHTLDAESLCKYKKECFRMIEIAVRLEESFVKIIEIKVIIEDVNDNQPEFPNKQVNLQFDETDGKGTTKSIPSAIDRDVGVLNSQITYELKKEADDPFELSVLKRVVGTEKLDVILERKLDREVKDIYMIQVIARDGGTPPKEGILNVQISVTDVNDNPPVFSQNIYNVSIENTDNKETPIVIISAKDFDSDKNGIISYYFNSETSDLAKSYFELNKSTGEIFLSKKITLKRRQTYKLYVEARDGGSPSLNSIAIVLVNIINQQNNAPRIDVKFVSKSENLAMISEGVKVGSFIAYVKVTDNDVGQNGEVTCDLHNDKIQLQALGRKKYKVIVENSVDREIESHIDFTIVCEDKGSPPLQTERRFSIQVMDVNDVQPQFTKDTFKFLTYENEKENFPVGYINATDPDLGPGGELIYSLLGNTKDILPFEISNFGFISTTHSLDHEQQEMYEFNVLVSDRGTPSLNNTANVIVEVIDENDNAPYFTFPSVNPFSLDVHYHPQSENDITVLRASDRDSHVNAFLRYEILGGNDKQLFTVNLYTGVLSFSRPVYQNDAGSYDLQLVVKDSGTPVLSATTTLSLTLTVSNSTSQIFTAIHTESDDMLHINLVVIIVVAAVIISTAIVVSIIVCIVQRQNQRDVQYGYRIDANNDFVGERRQSEDICEQMSPKYDAPVTMETNPSSNRNSQTAVEKRGLHSGYKSGHNWKDLALGIQLKASTDDTSQTSVNSGNGKEENHIVLAPDHCNEMSTIFSQINRGHGCNERNAGHYEELTGLNSCQLKDIKNGDGKSLPRTLSRPKNTSTKSSYQSDVGQNTPCNDVIDLKSFRVSSNASPTISSQQPWNILMRDSFTSYTKPLPAIPKVSYS